MKKPLTTIVLCLAILSCQRDKVTTKEEFVKRAEALGFKVTPGDPARKNDTTFANYDQELKYLEEMVKPWEAVATIGDTSQITAARRAEIQHQLDLLMKKKS